MKVYIFMAWPQFLHEPELPTYRKENLYWEEVVLVSQNLQQKSRQINKYYYIQLTVKR